MAFVVAKRPVAAAPISVSVYKADGTPVTIDFVAMYHRHTLDQVVDLQDSIKNKIRESLGESPVERDGGRVIPTWTYATDADLVREKMAGWSGVTVEGGEALPFSVDALNATLANWPEIVGPLFNGFFEAHKEAREKN